MGGRHVHPPAAVAARACRIRGRLPSSTLLPSVQLVSDVKPCSRGRCFGSSCIPEIVGTSHLRTSCRPRGSSVSGTSLSLSRQNAIICGQELFRLGAPWNLSRRLASLRQLSTTNDDDRNAGTSDHPSNQVLLTPSSVWKRKTQRLLQEPPTDDASISSSSILHQRSEIEESLKWWSRQRPVTSESVDVMWKLWQRLLRLPIPSDTTEKETSTAISPSVETTATPTMTSLLNLVLDQWRLRYWEGDHNNKPQHVADPYSIHTIFHQLQTPYWLYANDKSFGLLLSALVGAATTSSTSTTSHGGRHSKADSRPLPYLANDIMEFCLSHNMQHNVVLWNTTISAWAKAPAHTALHASDHALRWFQQMKQQQESRPNEITYASVLQAIHTTATAVAAARTPTSAPGGNLPSLSELASQSLQLLEEMPSMGIMPNDVCYLHVLQTLVTCKRLHEAHALLQERIQEYQFSVHPPTEEQAFKDDDSSLQRSKVVLKPTAHMFGAVMAGFAKNGNVDQVLALWTELQNLYSSEDDVNNDGSTVSTLNFVLQALAQSRTLECAERAHQVLEHICATHSSVDTSCYNTVLHAWAECVHHNPRYCVKRAETLLQQMPRPDTISYTSTIKAWARSDLPEAVERCMAFLQAMWEHHDNKNSTSDQPSSVKPNAITYSTVLYAWSRSSRKDAPLEAERVFRDMMDRYKDGEHDLRPNEASYVALMTTWNRSNLSQASNRVQFFFDQWKGMCVSNRWTVSRTVYHTLLQSKRRSGDGIQAERILQQMLQDHQRGHNRSAPRPTAFTFQLVMNAYVNSKSSKATERIEDLLRQMKDIGQNGWTDCKPTATTYAILLSAFARSPRRDAPERASDYLYEMISSNDPNIKPTASCYAAVLHAWSRSRLGHAPEQAQALFDEMMEKFHNGDEACRPNTEACAALLSAWSRSHRPDSALKAMSLLIEMEDRYQQNPKHDCPNWMHYSTVISAFAEKGDVDNAKALLDQIMAKKDVMEPHVGCYNGYVKAIVKSGAPDAAERAELVLRRMPSLGHGRPDTVTYTTCLTAWQQVASHHPNALERAEALLLEMMQLHQTKDHTGQGPRVKPNLWTFLTYLRIVAQSPFVSDRLERAEQTIQRMNDLGVRPTREFWNEVNRMKLESVHPQSDSDTKPASLTLQTSNETDPLTDLSRHCS